MEKYNVISCTESKKKCPFQKRLLARHYTSVMQYSECGEFSFSERHRTQKKNPTACNKQIEHTLLTPKRIHLFYIKRNFSFFIPYLSLFDVCLCFSIQTTCSASIWRKLTFHFSTAIFYEFPFAFYGVALQIVDGSNFHRADSTAYTSIVKRFDMN